MRKHQTPTPAPSQAGLPFPVAQGSGVAVSSESDCQGERVAEAPRFSGLLRRKVGALNR